MIPSYEELELPLLQALSQKGGKARPSELYQTLSQALRLTESDLSETVPTGDNKFKNRVRWARQILIDKGDMYRADYGVWGITNLGKERLQSQLPTVPQTPVERQAVVPIASTVTNQIARPLVNLEEIADNYAGAFERKILEELKDREPSEFEAFAMKLLAAYGFRKLRVTNQRTAPDGGIDGNGELKVGLANMRAAFQCKGG